MAKLFEFNPFSRKLPYIGTSPFTKPTLTFGEVASTTAKGTQIKAIVLADDSIDVSFTYTDEKTGKTYQVSGTCRRTEIKAPEGAPSNDAQG